MSEGAATGQPPKSPVKASSPYKVYRQGFLLKSPPRSVRKKLHRYWFVLFKQKDMLAFIYFQDEDHYLERKKNEGFFRIDDCTSIDVIPEHLGRKNAFCISTPRSNYYLVSESRYELHHWLLALHGAMDDYKNSTAQRTNSAKKKQKQRSQSTTSPPTSLPRNTPRIKPTRPAPPAPPKDKKKGDEENFPPPLNTEPRAELTESFQSIPSPTTNKLDDIVAGLLDESHQPTTLDYTLTEDDDIPIGNGEDNEETGSLSTSLPMLNDHGGNKKRNTDESNSDEDPSPQHTRHLSFSDSYEFQQGRSVPKKKSVKKRAGSMKGRRSISPPNLPPPPPPPTDEMSTDSIGDHVINSFERIEKETLTNKSLPKPPPPQRTTSLNPNIDPGVAQYLDEAFNQEDDHVESISHQNDGKPHGGILRKGEQSKPSKRTVMFDDHSKGQYEPMVDHEHQSMPNTVAQAKVKLFGNHESESYRYNRTQLQGFSNVEPQDELLEAIETALQPTSYMEQGKQGKGGFTIDIGPPNVPPPVRPSHGAHNGGGAYSLETSPNEVNSPNPSWANPTIDDTPTTTTFTTDQETMYRSIV